MFARVTSRSIYWRTFAIIATILIVVRIGGQRGMSSDTLTTVSAVASADPAITKASLTQYYDNKFRRAYHDYHKLVIASADRDAIAKQEKVIEDLESPNLADSRLKVILEKADSASLTPDDKSKFEAITNEVFENFLNTAKINLKPASIPPPVIPNALSDSGTPLPEEFDILADPTIKGKYTAALARKYFPDGKTSTKNGFDKLESKLQETKIVDYLTSYLEAELSRNDAFIAKFESDAQQRDAVLSAFRAKNKSVIAEIASSIVKTKGNPPLVWGSSKPMWHAEGDEFVPKLNTFLKLENAKFNKDKEPSISRESKSDRGKRLLKSAEAYVLKEVPLAASVDDVSKTILSQYANQQATPLELLKPEPVTTPDSEFDDLEQNVKSGIREMYRKNGGFTQFLGVFGLKGFVAELIIKAVADRIGKALDEKQKAKAHSWAADLAAELGGSGGGGGQQPTNIFRPQPWPNTNTLAPIPYIPHGYMHQSHKFGHHWPAMYLNPDAGGYVVMPR